MESTDNGRSRKERESHAGGSKKNGPTLTLWECRRGSKVITLRALIPLGKRKDWLEKKRVRRVP